MRITADDKTVLGKYKRKRRKRKSKSGWKKILFIGLVSLTHGHAKEADVM